MEVWRRSGRFTPGRGSLRLYHNHSWDHNRESCNHSWDHNHKGCDHGRDLALLVLQVLGAVTVQDAPH